MDNRYRWRLYREHNVYDITEVTFGVDMIFQKNIVKSINGKESLEALAREMAKEQRKIRQSDIILTTSTSRLVPKHERICAPLDLQEFTDFFKEYNKLIGGRLGKSFA